MPCGDAETLGGDNGIASWINDGGAVAGVADLPDGTHHGFLWKNGAMQDLAPIGGAPCSNAYAINGRDQVVGNITDCHGNSFGAVLWDHGTAYDLTRFAPTSVFLSEGYYINDRGEIASFSFLPNGDVHQVVLVPADLATRQGLSTAFVGMQSASSAEALGEPLPILATCWDRSAGT